MPTLDDPKLEAFARALARDGSLREASHQAGYSPKAHRRGDAERRAKGDQVVLRVAELRAQAEWGEALDSKPIFDLTMKLAAQAEQMDTPAALAAAKGLLAEAARMKEALSRPETAAEPEGPTLPDLSKEEWLAAFAPKS